MGVRVFNVIVTSFGKGGYKDTHAYIRGGLLFGILQCIIIIIIPILGPTGVGLSKVPLNQLIVNCCKYLERFTFCN